MDGRLLRLIDFGFQRRGLPFAGPAKNGRRGYARLGRFHRGEALFANRSSQEFKRQPSKQSSAVEVMVDGEVCKSRKEVQTLRRALIINRGEDGPGDILAAGGQHKAGGHLHFQVGIL